jgi:hypothetical protein
MAHALKQMKEGKQMNSQDEEITNYELYIKKK